MSTSPPSPFPRRPVGAQPTTGGLDELLDKPPPTPTGGTLNGYRAGRILRGLIFGALVCGTAGVFAGGYALIRRWEDQQQRGVAPDYQVDYKVDNADQSLYWDADGQARLGLTRDEAGVHQVVLPDKIVELADGYDHAVFTVTLRDNTTTDIQLVTGRIELRDR